MKIPPVVLIVLIAPFFGEGLSGATPPLDLILPWKFGYMVMLYGCGALLCREVARRLGLGFAGLVVLGMAYGVWEEALVDRYWFFPTFWADSGIGTYSVEWHTNVLLAFHLTAFHSAISVCSSVLVVEWLAPRYRDRPWVGRRGMIVAALLLAATPVVYGEFDQRPPVVVLAAAVVLLVLLVVAAVVIGRRGTPAPAAGRGRRLGVLVFGCVLAHWILTYAVPSTGIPWPAGVGLALLPVVAGVIGVRRLAVTGPYGADGVRVVTGVLVFFALLDVLLAVLGRYDMIVSALLAAILVRQISRRTLGSDA